MQFFFGFSTLANDTGGIFLTGFVDAFHHRLAQLIVVNSHDHADIQLDEVWRKCTDMVDAGIAVAKVINGNLKILLGIVADHIQKGGHVCDGSSFGDFKDDIRWQ